MCYAELILLFLWLLCYNSTGYMVILCHLCPVMDIGALDCLLFCLSCVILGFRQVLTLDDCLSSRVLVGTGRVCIETLRPLAYTLLAELVHYVRGDLSLPLVDLIL